MAADQIELRTTTFTKGHGWLDSYGTLLRDNDILLGRGRWTTGETVLAQVDCQPGAWQIQPGDRILRTWRLDGTATADDAARLLLSTPHRGTWHSDDNSGAPPPLDNRAVKGDSCQIDTGSGDSYVLHYDGSRFRGYGVLAEYRTAATATNGTTQNQASERITMRSSRWDTSGTPAAKDREWSFLVGTSASGPDSYSLLKAQRRHEGGSWTDVLSLDTNGWLYLSGPVPGLELNSGGAGNAYIRATATDPDGSVFQFAHGNSSRWARFRFMAATGGASGTAAEAIGLRYGSEATGGTTLVKSPSAAWWASAWDGVSAAVELGAYAQHIPTADDAGYLRHGFGYGVGTSDHYSDGAVLLTMDREGASAYGGALTIAPHEVSGPSTADFIHSPYYSALAYSGVAGGARSIAWNAQIDSDADADDRWSLRFVAVGGGGPSEILGVRDTGEIIPADGSAGVLELSAALGTHSGTTASDKTGNASIGTIKVVDASGAIIGHIPIFSDT